MMWEESGSCEAIAIVQGEMGTLEIWTRDMQNQNRLDLVTVRETGPWQKGEGNENDIRILT